MFGFRRRRREKLKKRPLPDAWWEIIDRRVPYARSLPAQDREELAGIVQILLNEKRFEGCDGLEITDEIRVTIAAQAAVLLLHRTTNYYPDLRTILVYPRAYVAHQKRRLPDGTIQEGPEPRLGESWFHGALVLSWADVIRGANDPTDGRNVVFHEFAHQLDAESGAMEGAPALGASDRYRAWAMALSREYRALIESVHRGHGGIISSYGATNPAEFFAVVTEVFFERPAALKQLHPALYDELAGFYQQNPAARQPMR